MSGDLNISRDDILAAALVFGGFQATFTVHDFTAFIQSQAHGAEEEDVDEILSDLADEGELRCIGPGVYAKLAVPLQHPVFNEEAPKDGAHPGGPRIGGKP